MESKSKLEALKFRQNVPPERRRWANKTLAEYDRVEAEYFQAKSDHSRCSDHCFTETEKLKTAQAVYNLAVENLSAAQKIIDENYLPEGAQPVDRIKARNKLLIKKQQAADSLAIQQGLTADARKRLEAAERKLFEADRSANRFAETLQTAMAVSAEIRDSDQQKEEKLRTIEQQTRRNQEKTMLNNSRKAAQIAQEKAEIEAKKHQQAIVLQAQAKERLEQTTRHLEETNRKRRQKNREMNLSVDLEADEPEPSSQSERIHSNKSNSWKVSSIQEQSLAMTHLRDELDAFTQRLTHSNGSTGVIDGVDVIEDVSSDEDEPNEAIDLHQTYNSLQKERNQRGESGPFHFYEFGTISSTTSTPESFEDILDRLGRSLSQPNSNPKPNLNRPSLKDEILMMTTTTSSKSFSIDQFQTLQLSDKEHQNRKISQFRLPHVSVNWDASFFPDKKLTKSLYRIPCSDPSGTVIRGVARAPTKKDCLPWVPPESDRNLPSPSTLLCSHTFQQSLISHLDKTVMKLRQEFELLPNATQEQRDQKARVGADLNNLEMERDAAKKELERN